MAENKEMIGKVLSIVEENPDIRAILEKAVEWEEKHSVQLENLENYGFQWHDIGVYPQKLNKLVTLGLLKVTYKSRSFTEYRLVDRESIKKALEIAAKTDEELSEMPVEIPDDLFSCIVGHEDVKKLMLKALKMEARVHFLLVGDPATAKSLFLEELERLGGRYYLGSSTSKAGLVDVLINEKPRILLIDELDKMNKEDMAALLSLMESGRVVECKYGKTRNATLNTMVVAAANNISKLPKELVSRFAVFRFAPYSQEEFVRVCEGVLTREGVSTELARYIAKVVYNYRPDIREAVRVARLAKTKDEVDEVIGVLRKYSPFSKFRWTT